MNLCSSHKAGRTAFSQHRSVLSRRRTAVWSGACHIAPQESSGPVGESSTFPAPPSLPERHRWPPKERRTHSREPASCGGKPDRYIDAGPQPVRRANRSSFGTMGQKVPAPIVVLFNLCRKYFVLAKFFIKRKNYEL